MTAPVPPLPSEDLGDLAPLGTTELRVQLIERADRRRFWLAVVLVACTASVLIIGLIKGAAVNDILALTAPVSGFTGAAIAYMFGAADRKE